jgi:hypothetical protein
MQSLAKAAAWFFLSKWKKTSRTPSVSFHYTITPFHKDVQFLAAKIAGTLALGVACRVYVLHSDIVHTNDLTNSF